MPERKQYDVSIIKLGFPHISIPICVHLDLIVLKCLHNSDFNKKLERQTDKRMERENKRAQRVAHLRKRSKVTVEPFTEDH